MGLRLTAFSSHCVPRFQGLAVSADLEQRQIGQRAVVEHADVLGLLFVDGHGFTIVGRRLVVFALDLRLRAPGFGKQGLDVRRCWHRNVPTSGFCHPGWLK